jgi:uncharacterized protein (TIGR03790 family)
MPREIQARSHFVPERAVSLAGFMRVLIVCGLMLATAAKSVAQSAENVLVVINEASPASRRIGDHYVQLRRVPPSNVIRLDATTAESVTVEEYARTIEAPIAHALNRGGLHDRILYMVLTKGVPLRISGTEGRTGTTASVDSELTMLYRRLTGVSSPLAGPVPNPYFLDSRPISEARPFTHRAHDIFLVARLDGFTVEDAIALIDRSNAPSTSGRIVLDQRSGANASADRWLAEAAARLTASGHGDRVMLENTPRAARGVDGVLGYYSWGFNDPENRVRRVGMQFLPGALAATFSSHDARTFLAPQSDWVPPSNALEKNKWFAGSPQTLAGDLINEGVTGLAANVAEPYLDGAVRPDILFPAYVAGFNLVEAFYLALPHLSWQTVVIGDPLCAPFRKIVLARKAIEDPMDPETELPGVFSQRRKDVVRLNMKDAPPAAVALAVLAGVRAARKDKEGARQALEKVVAMAPGVAYSQFELAMLYEEVGEHDLAIARYREVVKLEPGNTVALNNLAYGLAVRQNALDEAISFARRAVKLSSTSATIIDTLAWIEHLRGNHREAAALLKPLVQKSTGNSQIHLHAAIIFAAAQDDAGAATQLREAVRLDATLESSDDVRALRAKLGKR